jgi:hypothetical protein
VRALVIVALLGGTAHADPLDEFAMGSRLGGMAGAGTAAGVGAEAVHLNPAGVAYATHPEVMLGYGYGMMRLALDGRDADVLDAHGTSLGLAVPVQRGRVRAAFGVAVYLPDQFIARIHLVPPTEPRFIRLDNDPHRAVIEPVLSVAIGEQLSLGAGATLLGDARGDGITFDVGVVAGEKVGESALDASLPVRAAPLAAVLYRPHPKVRAGVAYRGELSLVVALDILANVDVADVVAGDALVSIRATNYFTPQRISAGVAVDPLSDLTLSADVSWNDWSAYPTGVADLRVLVALDVTPPLVQTDVPPAGFHDVFEARAGAEYRLRGARTHYAFRGGLAYLPSPVPDQVGLTSFADNDRLLASLGGGITLADWAPILTRPIDISLALQWQHLAQRVTVKDAMDFPGEPFSSAGNIFHLGASTTVRF